MAKNRKITAKIRELERLYASLPENQKKLLRPVIEKFAFMDITLSGWQESMTEDVDSEDKAKFLRNYNSTMRSYVSVYKELRDKLPEDLPKSKLSGLIGDE